MKITVRDVWMGDGTMYVWFVDQNGHTMSGSSPTMLKKRGDGRV